MIEVKSGGNPGHGLSSIFGIMPPRSVFTFSSWSEETVRVSPSMSHLMPSLLKEIFSGLMSFAFTPVIVMEPFVAAARPMNEPISIKSGPMVKSAPPSFFTPSITSMFEPIPLIFAPIRFSMLHRSCTWGSLAAFVISVLPSARTAAITAFSVAVTDASSKNNSLPTSLFAVNSNLFVTATRAPSSVSARKCVSSLRLPITSPPGGKSAALPVLATRGPANKMDARIFFVYSLGMSVLFISAAVIFQMWFPPFSTFAPRALRISSITPVSSMSGMLRSVTVSFVRSAAAMQGRAAFLLPLALIVPEIG